MQEKKKKLKPELGRSDMVLRKSIAPVGSGARQDSGRAELSLIVPSQWLHDKS